MRTMWNGFNRLALCAATLLAAFGLSASAATVPVSFTGSSTSDFVEIGFSKLTNNGTPAIEDNFKLHIFDIGSNQLGFRFLNTGETPVTSRISELYFYDGHLIKNGTVVGPSGVFASDGTANPGNLPGFNPTVKELHLTRFYAADAQPSGSGVLEGGYVDVRFDLLSGITLDRVLSDLTNDLSPPAAATPFFVGIHVQSIDPRDKSESFLANPFGGSTPPSNPSAVPLPGVAWAGIALLSGLGGMRAFRKRNNATDARE